MNEQRVPINLYTLDVESGHEMTEEELQKLKKHDCKPWFFLLRVCCVFIAIFIFMNVKAGEVLLGIWAWMLIYIFLGLLMITSIYKIEKISGGAKK